MPKIVHRLRKETTNYEQLTTNRKSKGFTLIEILVVISIMAILAGGLLYSTENTRNKGKDARRKQDLKTISAALISYKADHGNLYPKTGTILNYASDIDNTWITDLPSDYIAKLPHDPANATTNATSAGDTVDCNSKTNIYCYIVSSDQKIFILWAQLENTNDLELYGNANSNCTANDFDSVANPSSPYLGLGAPAGGFLNYCLKSPQ